MSGTPTNARSWALAKVLAAPLGSTAPADTTSDWDAAWEELGIVSNDSLTQGQEAQMTDKFDSEGNLVRTLVGQEKRTFKFVPWEDSEVVFRISNPGADVSTDGDVTTRVHKKHKHAPMMFGFELLDGDITKRAVIESGQIFKSGTEVKYTIDDITGEELTVSVYPDGDGNFFKEITDDPAAAVTGS